MSYADTPCQAESEADEAREEVSRLMQSLATVTGQLIRLRVEYYAALDLNNRLSAELARRTMELNIIRMETKP
jgi:hypothetical protein